MYFQPLSQIVPPASGRGIARLLHQCGSLLLGLSDNDGVVLHLSLGGIEARKDGFPLVPFDKREAVEEVLQMLGQSTPRWLEVCRMSGEPDALRASAACFGSGTFFPISLMLSEELAARRVPASQLQVKSFQLQPKYTTR